MRSHAWALSRRRGRTTPHRRGDPRHQAPNTLLDTQNVWVTDFGLAKLVEGDELSQSRDLVGTMRFMALERFRGVTDPMGDVYSLGASRSTNS